jgi:tRNA modification GTPase
MISTGRLCCTDGVCKATGFSYICSETMRKSETDTIAAIATPLGEGGISVVRISGPDAITIAGEAFRGKMALSSVASHTAHFGKIVGEEGEVVDEVVATVFLRPNSYSGENTVEISCHGGILVTRRILERVLRTGARLAEPGEFTKRAFLNGRIDLSQAEAVAEHIHARSDSALSSSVHQLEGALSERIHKLRSNLIDSIGLLELELDFVEEDLEFVDKKKFRQAVRETVAEIDHLLSTFKAGRIYREGVKVVIAGAPNAGKSSLLNALLESNRAIVTDIPGTTRDTIEEAVAIEGVSFRLTDTAGLRETTDIVEREGVRRTEDEARMGDVVLLVLDASLSARADQTEIRRFVTSLAPLPVKCIFVVNKTDLPSRKATEILTDLGIGTGSAHVEVSAKTRSGLETLQKLLVETAFSGGRGGIDSSATVTNIRHYEALARAKRSLRLSLDSLEQGQSSEFVVVDLRNALDCLGEVTGEVTSEEILNNIFSKFCIGK